MLRKKTKIKPIIRMAYIGLPKGTKQLFIDVMSFELEKRFYEILKLAKIYEEDKITEEK